MGLYKYLLENWKNQPKSLLKSRLIEWRQQPVSVRLEQPTKLTRARALGFVKKPGVFIVRQRIGRGGHKRPQFAGGRRSRNMGKKLILRKNYRLIAEERVAKKYKNCEVVNSYYVLKDGKHYWFEVIMMDRTNPNVLTNQTRSELVSRKGRAFRGITSAGRKIRGLRYKGKGAEKARPSRRANSRSL